MGVISTHAQQLLYVPDLLPLQYHLKEGNSSFLTSEIKINTTCKTCEQPQCTKARMYRDFTYIPIGHNFIED